VSLTVDVPAARANIVDMAILRAELAAPESADVTLKHPAREASVAVETYCNRTFARAAYTEVLPGYGGPILMLSRTPVVAVAAVTGDSQPILDYAIEDPAAGFLYRRLGWAWSRGIVFGLDESTAPGFEARPYAVSYTAGYLVPDDDVASALLSVEALDQSFNLASGAFPLLVAGDVIESSEFSVAGNNGTWTVVSRTATKVVVAGASLVDEAAAATGSNPKTLQVRTLPADVERAAVDTAKARFLGRARDPMVSSRSITGLSISYAGGGGNPLAIPPVAAGLLSPHRRIV
jgi:hypothetical protein